MNSARVNGMSNTASKLSPLVGWVMRTSMGGVSDKMVLFTSSMSMAATYMDKLVKVDRASNVEDEILIAATPIKDSKWSRIIYVFRAFSGGEQSIRIAIDNQ